PYISTGIKRNKFGMNRREILKAIEMIKGLEQIQLRGLSIHIGSQLSSLSPLEDSFVKLSSLVDEVEKKGFPLRFVDLGGGLGISYNGEKVPEIRQYCRLIHKIFGKNSKFKGKLKIVLEPGRQISGNAGILLTQILYRKERKPQEFLIVDAAM